ncbi:hypothetical protein [Sphingorhabdus sp.]|uniref:hypothetical protein n=1 Tax=Sphingorhabdus sp. TaxID=1902408 RepID=UPI0035B35D31|nr:hypothetical protein [Sphingomonadaceae bacterium]
MSWGGPAFVVAMIAIMYGGWILNNWIRARHGYPLEDEWGGKSDKGLPDSDRKIGLLTSENEALQGKISRLEERVAVLERIATDTSSRLSEEIEALRGPAN